MFRIFAIIRLRKNILLVPWDITSTASSHGNSLKRTSQHVSAMFGSSTHYQTLVGVV